MKVLLALSGCALGAMIFGALLTSTLVESGYRHRLASTSLSPAIVKAD